MASSKKPTPNGKGDRDRSDPVKYAKGYERIFGKKKRGKTGTQQTRSRGGVQEGTAKGE